MKRLFIKMTTPKEPFSLFRIWFDEACAAPDMPQPRAMCLATCTRAGLPSARYVMLRKFSLDGFVFFTNYASRKGKELEENPNAALVFYWEPLKKSVRIEGTVMKISEDESCKSFYSMPRDKQLLDAFSNQSQPVSSRSTLRENEIEFKKKYLNCNNLLPTVPKPDEWGGYILKPHTMEFWQGKSDRLHDRIHFKIPKENDNVDGILLHEGEDGWVYETLYP